MTIRSVLALIACAVSGVAAAQGLVLDTSRVDFPEVREGLCRNAEVAVRYEGAASTARPEIMLLGSEAFSIHLSDRRCPADLAPGDACRIRIRFCPPWQGTYRATLRVGTAGEVMIEGDGILASF